MLRLSGLAMLGCRTDLLTAASLAKSGFAGETYEPVRLASRMHAARVGHTATLLPDGQVLVAGGENDAGCTLTSTEIYDPATQTWSLTAPMHVARAGHFAVRLRTGEVLVIGGLSTSAGSQQTSQVPLVTSSAEIYSPSTGRWQPTKPVPGAFLGGSALLLQVGTVLVVGLTSTGIRSTAGFDPHTGAWTLLPAPPLEMVYDMARLLPNGTVLSVATTPGSAEAALYVPRRGQWISLPPSMHAPFRSQATSTLLASGEVLLVGGLDRRDRFVSSAEVFQVAPRRWRAVQSLPLALAGHAAVLLPDGTVAILGGATPLEGLSDAVWTYTPRLDRWTPGPALRQPRSDFTATVLPDGTVLVAGGSSRSGTTATTEIVRADR
jgi:hypothetical protein